MRKWAMGLHFYQPPIQDLGITKQVLQSCYIPLLKLIKSQPEVRLTVNMAGCLLEQLQKMQQTEFFDLLNEVVASGQVELINSPAFHLIMPLSPMEVVERQIEKQAQFTRETTGQEMGKGLFPPELAVTEKVAEWARGKFDYLVVDETAVSEDFNPQTIWQKPVMTYRHVKLAVNCRAVSDALRAFPKRISEQKLVKFVSGQTPDNGMIVTMNDAEVFGHHYEERMEVLERLFEGKEFKFIQIQEAVQSNGEAAEKIKPSSWQVWLGEEKADPFLLWADPNNSLQQKYLLLMKLATKTLNEWGINTEAEKVVAAKEFLDKGYSSCYLYWLSNWPWWHPDLVQKGADQLVRCIRTLEAPGEIKRRAEEMYHEFLKEMWLRHWSGQVKAMHDKFGKMLEEKKQVIWDLE